MGSILASFIRNVFPAEEIITNNIPFLKPGPHIDSAAAIRLESLMECGGDCGDSGGGGGGEAGDGVGGEDDGAGGEDGDEGGVGDRGGEGGGEGEGVVGAEAGRRGRFTIIPVEDSALPASQINRWSNTTTVTSRINNETQTLSGDITFWQRHEARIKRNVCFTAATVALCQFIYSQVESLIKS